MYVLVIIFIILHRLIYWKQWLENMHFLMLFQYKLIIIDTSDISSTFLLVIRPQYDHIHHWNIYNKIIVMGQWCKSYE